jgi:hypothetical protein
MKPMRRCSTTKGFSPGRILLAAILFVGATHGARCENLNDLPADLAVPEPAGASRRQAKGSRR